MSMPVICNTITKCESQRWPHMPNQDCTNLIWGHWFDFCNHIQVKTHFWLWKVTFFIGVCQIQSESTSWHAWDPCMNLRYGGTLVSTSAHTCTALRVFWPADSISGIKQQWKGSKTIQIHNFFIGMRQILSLEVQYSSVRTVEVHR